MFLSVIYLLVRCVLGCLMVRARREVSNGAELLVLRHENTMLRRQTSKIRYQPGDRPWLAALFRLIPGIASPHSAAGAGRLLLVPGAASRASMPARTAPTTPGVQSMHNGKVLRRPEGHDSETVRGGRARPRQMTIGPPLAGNLDRAFGDDDQRAGLVGAVGG